MHEDGYPKCTIKIPDWAGGRDTYTYRGPAVLSELQLQEKTENQATTEMPEAGDLGRQASLTEVRIESMEGSNRSDKEQCQESNRGGWVPGYIGEYQKWLVQTRGWAEERDTDTYRGPAVLSELQLQEGTENQPTTEALEAGGSGSQASLTEVTIESM
jgi:hypothetical protein